MTAENFWNFEIFKNQIFQSFNKISASTNRRKNANVSYERSILGHWHALLGFSKFGRGKGDLTPQSDPPLSKFEHILGNTDGL